MNYQTIIYEVADNIATIRLNRPDKMNALNARMRGELADAWTRAPDEARAVVMTGEGPGFCAGQDLGDTGGFDDLNLEQTLLEEYLPMIRAIADCPVPTICAVNGAAAGAGANMALAADIVIAARSASFLQAFARIGLVPDAGGTYWLPRLVGPARAMGMSLLADKIPANVAVEWGLIWEVVEDEALASHTQELAGRLASGPTKAYGMIKRALRESRGNDFTTQFELEASLQNEAGNSRDFREGVMAFLQKRPAEFQGR